jgi:hypothetical protein
MLHEEVEEAGFVLREFGEGGGYVVGDEVGAARFAGEGYGFLEPVRCGLGYVYWVWLLG